MTVLVVLAGESLGVVFAGQDRTLLGALGLMGEHVRLYVLENIPAVRVGTLLLLLGLLAAIGFAPRGYKVTYAWSTLVGVNGGGVRAAGEKRLVEGDAGLDGEGRGAVVTEHGRRGGARW